MKTTPGLTRSEKTCLHPSGVPMKTLTYRALVSAHLTPFSVAGGNDTFAHCLGRSAGRPTQIAYQLTWLWVRVEFPEMAIRSGHLEHTSHTTDDSRETDQPIRIGGTILGAHRHICAFFKSHDDQYRVLLPFIKEGLNSGEKAVHIVNPARRDEHVRQLGSAGIDVAAVQENGQLDLLDWADAHLRGGHFDQNSTRSLMKEIRRRGKEQGFQRIRFVTHMEWALEDRPGVDALLEYEASANLVPSEDPVICAYELTNFGGDVIVDIMRTHPMIIIGGILQENPFFVPPNEFLRELRARRGSDQATSSLEDRGRA